MLFFFQHRKKNILSGKVIYCSWHKLFQFDQYFLFCLLLKQKNRIPLQFKSTRLSWFVFCLSRLAEKIFWVKSTVIIIAEYITETSIWAFFLPFTFDTSSEQTDRSDQAKSRTFISFQYLSVSVFILAILLLPHPYFELHYFSPMQLIKGWNKPAKMHKNASAVLNKTLTEAPKKQTKKILLKWRKLPFNVSETLTQSSGVALWDEADFNRL